MTDFANFRRILADFRRIFCKTSVILTGVVPRLLYFRAMLVQGSRAKIERASSSHKQCASKLERSTRVVFLILWICDWLVPFGFASLQEATARWKLATRFATVDVA
jgi:hypothetical protein